MTITNTYRGGNVCADVFANEAIRHAIGFRRLDVYHSELQYLLFSDIVGVAVPYLYFM